MTDEHDYEIGYGKPPKEFLWKKNQSGNRRGRPRKKEQSIADLIENTFAKKITITEKGRRRRSTVFELILHMLWKKATIDHNKKALRVLHQYEAFSSRLPKIVVYSSDGRAEEYRRRLLGYDEEPETSEERLKRYEKELGKDYEKILRKMADEDPYLILPNMTAREASDRYYKSLEKGNEEWQRKKALKRRPYTSGL